MRPSSVLPNVVYDLVASFGFSHDHSEQPFGAAAYVMSGAHGSAPVYVPSKSPMSARPRMRAVLA
jgi:hypothetical protein